jgi:chromosome partitioning protein
MPQNSICFVNFKGGVGKTSVAVNVAATLAREPFDKKVLLIDLDAQANASIWAMGATNWQKQVLKNPQNTVFQVFHDKEYQTSAFKFKKAVVRNPFRGALAPNLDLLPSTYRMMEAEDLLWRIRPDEPVQHIVKEALEPFLETYDVVIIDCPPNTYRVTQNAIAMSRFIFVPCIPDYLSLVGLRELVSRLERLGGILGAKHGKVIPIRGVIVNRFRAGLLATAAGMAELSRAVRDLRNAGLLLPKCELMKPSIKDTTAFAQAAEQQVPIFGIKGSIAAEAIQQYKELSENVLGSLEA